MARPQQTKEQFVSKVIVKYGDAYDVSGSDYRGFKIPVDVVCKRHGTFSITPQKLLNKTACPACGVEGRSLKQALTVEDFVTKSVELHGDRYDYSLVEYQNNRSQVNIVCREHGVFNQKAMNHLNGRGCKKCAPSGYNQSKKGYLYVLEGDGVVKVGITNQQPKRRARRVELDSGRTFSTVASWAWDDGSVALKIETEVLSEFRSKYTQPDDKFDGSTECFTGIGADVLISRIEELLNDRN